MMKKDPLWCDCCDMNIVYPDMPESGRFFMQFGHVVRGGTVQEYVGVIYALCNACLKERNENEVKNGMRME